MNGINTTATKATLPTNLRFAKQSISTLQHFFDFYLLQVTRQKCAKGINCLFMRLAEDSERRSKKNCPHVNNNCSFADSTSQFRGILNFEFKSEQHRARLAVAGAC
jgi:hypothetical protein